MNYLIDRLPRDLFTHLFQYSKLLVDFEIYSFAKCSRTILRLVGPKYEHIRQFEWYLYRCVDIESVGLQLPWRTNEEKSRYVIESHTTSQTTVLVTPLTDPRPSTVNEWVVVRHRIELLTEAGCTSLPFDSLQPNAYEHTAHTIGLVIALILWAPKPPPPTATQSSNRPTTGSTIPKWSVDLLRLPHLRFIPTTITDLRMDDLCIDEMDTIQTYVWPRKLQSLQLYRFNPCLFNEPMLLNWPRSLERLILNVSTEGGMQLESWDGRIFFPSTLLSLELDECVDTVSNAILGASLPKSLTYLKCSPRSEMKELKLHETSLQRLEFNEAIDFFSDDEDGWVLPASLLELHLGQGNWNHLMASVVFNTSLTRLTLGGFHRRPHRLRLPDSLVWLEFGHEFGVGEGQTLADIKLPIGLQTLKHKSRMDASVLYQSARFNFPSSLTHLELGRIFDPESTPTSQVKLILSETLVQLTLPHLLVAAVEQLPTKLEHLVLTSSEMTLKRVRPKDMSADIIRDRVTANVIERLNQMFARMSQLHHLEIEFDWIETVFDRLILPVTIETLIIGGEFLSTDDQVIRHIEFGSKLKQFTFQGEFNQSLAGVVFPDSLQELTFLTDRFNQPLDGVTLPSQLISLEFSTTSKFNQPIHRIKLPSSLKALRLPPNYNQPLTGLIIPPQLRVFEVGDTDDTSRFKHIDSFLHLNFPSTINWIILPHPSSTHLKTHSHLPDYHEWIERQRHTHPYAHIQFTLVEPIYTFQTDSDSDDEDEDEDEEDDLDEDDESEDDDKDDDGDMDEDDDADDSLSDD